MPPGVVAGVGRSAANRHCLLVEGVSRRHATLLERDGAWFVLDEGSTTGTRVNGVPLAPQRPALLAPGDLVEFGPCLFHVGAETAEAGTAQALDDRASSIGLVATTAIDPAGPERRLALLGGLLERLGSAPDEPTLAALIAEAALAGTALERAAIVRETDRAAGRLAVIATAGDQADAIPFSRSLLARAAEHGTATLRPGAGSGAHDGRSIADLGVHAALCVAVRLGPTIAGFLYLDARRGGAAIGPGDVAYADALARAHALALADLRRRELERRQRELEIELDAARAVQRTMLPESIGIAGAVRWAARLEPGLVVAGDLFDVVPRPDGSVALAFGDVAGHGLGSGMLMAQTQAHLHAVLHAGAGPEEAAAVTNDYLAARAEGGRFVTLWVGVVRPEGTLRAVDAGHGLAWRLDAAGESEPLASPGGIPLGITPGVRYEASEVELAPGSRLLLLSDGVTECRNEQGEEFGAERLAAALRGSPGCADDVRRIFAAIDDFADGAARADDASAASIAVTMP